MHLAVGGVEGTIVKMKIVLVVNADAALVKDAKNLVKTIVNDAVQTRYLHNDAVVVQALHKTVGYALHHGLVLIVEHLMAHIDDRVFYVAHRVAKQVDSHHRQGMAVGTVGHDVLRVLVVHAQILAEAKGLGGQPRLLQLYQYELLLTVVLPDGGPEVNAEDRQRLLLSVGVLVWAHLHLHDVFFQQGRENGACYAFVLHEVLEHYVVDGIGNGYHGVLFFSSLLFSFRLLCN